MKATIHVEGGKHVEYNFAEEDSTHEWLARMEEAGFIVATDCRDNNEYKVTPLGLKAICRS